MPKVKNKKNGLEFDVTKEGLEGIRNSPLSKRFAVISEESQVIEAGYIPPEVKEVKAIAEPKPKAKTKA